MDYIRKISEMYHENISLYPPCQTKSVLDVPAEITSILHISDGICETMANPETGEVMPIGWIIYPYEMIQSDTAFYKAEYKIDGVVFSDDGAGNPFVLKPDGTVVCFNAIDDEEDKVSNSLSDFWEVKHRL